MESFATKFKESHLQQDMLNIEHDLNETIERLDTKNELVSSVVDRLVETLRNIEPQKYSLNKIRERGGLKPKSLFDQLSGSGKQEEEEDAVVL